MLPEQKANQSLYTTTASAAATGSRGRWTTAQRFSGLAQSRLQLAPTIPIFLIDLLDQLGRLRNGPLSLTDHLSAAGGSFSVQSRKPPPPPKVSPRHKKATVYTELYGEVMYRPPRWTVFETFERLSPR